MSATNLLLQDAGYQSKDCSGAWVPTATAMENKHWIRRAYSKNGHSGVSLLWEIGFVRKVLEKQSQAA